ncbi:hypothetical protein ALC53_06114 [Atta colombica]|uniref:Uncharacterized protein n=1 Tax=Atta colombica TaxID=520822 RepID=A0A195BGV5_9HYME|nr:hypothetical protein ALC53_06114 [Atta colombica]
MREDWYKPRVQGHECEGYRTSLPPSRANLSDTVRRYSLFHTREKEEEEEEQRERAPNEGSGRHLPPPPSRLINVILLDGQASTTIDTWRGGGGGGGGGGGDGGGGGSDGSGGGSTFASRGTRNEERDETDGAERKGHRPAPQTDWPHSLRYPKRALTVKRKINPEILQQHGDLRIYAPPGEVSGMRHAPTTRSDELSPDDAKNRVSHSSNADR